MTAPLQIRLATPADLPAINAIYNHFVAVSTCTYQTEPSTAAERLDWFRAHGEAHPITVATLDSRVVAWCSLSRFHPRAAYGRTVESSIYVDQDHHRRGLGRLLMLDIIARARTLHYHTIIAGISADQAASVRLHESLGFAKVAHLREVGNKFDRWLDVVLYQLML